MKSCWDPVRNTGCGWLHCPECGPLVALEIEAEHLRIVQRTILDGPLIGSMAGNASALDDQKHSVRDRRKAARASRAQFRETQRVKRILTPEQQQAAMWYFEKRAKRLRPFFSRIREEWLAEAWLELVNPSRLVDRRERRRVLKSKLRSAIYRAQRNLQRRAKDDAKYVFVNFLP